jgi:hypothetical protein
LAVFLLPETQRSADGKTFASPHSIEKVAEGKLVPSTMITAIYAASRTETGKIEIVTADQAGDIWRWEPVSGPDNEWQNFAPSVRLHGHRGSAIGVVSFLDPVDGERWVASLGADDRVLLSPIGVMPLLRTAGETLGADNATIPTASD